MDFQNKYILCKARGGSHAYGLQTAQSDIDYRGVFINTDVSHLFGLKKDEVLTTQNEKTDEVFTELRHAFKLLRSANTQMIELLYMQDWEIISPQWEHVQRFANHLIDSQKLLTSLLGYMRGELLLANGTRTGKLGGKRKEAVDRFGFSPKNFCQLLRLAWAGKIYFEKGHFPVNIPNYDLDFADVLFDIKTRPEKYTCNELNARVTEAEAALKLAYENRKYTTIFDEDVVDVLCYQTYLPFIQKL